MAHKMFDVEVVSRQRAFYTVEAHDAETAREMAAARWRRREPSDVAGIEASELLSARAREVPDATRQEQDDELILRFVKERERLILRLGGKLVNASINDAISAAQAAADLGWYAAGDNGEMHADVLRAASALERLCEKQRLTCFPRQRVRAGELGEIRLYCTPEYLDRLSTALSGPPPRRATRRSAADRQ
jgi:hypothetical protein